MTTRRGIRSRRATTLTTVLTPEEIKALSTSAGNPLAATGEGVTPRIQQQRYGDVLQHQYENSDPDSIEVLPFKPTTTRDSGSTFSLITSSHEVEAKNQGDIASALYRANQTHRDNQPRNTRIMYDRKQNEWSEWCLSERNFKDKDTVYEGKLVLWLEERIIPRGNNSRGPKRGAKLSTSGLEAYVKSVVALYEVISSFSFALHRSS